MFLVTQANGLGHDTAVAGADFLGDFREKVDTVCAFETWLCGGRNTDGFARHFLRLLVGERFQLRPEAVFDALQSLVNPVRRRIGRTVGHRVRQSDNRAARRIVRPPERASRGATNFGLNSGSQPAASLWRRISATSISAPSVHPPTPPHFRFGRRGGNDFHASSEVGRVQIVFSRDADQSEEGVSTRVGQRSPHPARRRRLADRADRPFRRQPFARRIGEDGRQSDPSRFLVDRSGQHGCDFAPAQRFANDV